MKDFRIKADAVFEAEDIDDAFLVLAMHFLDLYRNSVDAKTIFEQGEVTIKPEPPKGEA